MRQAVSMETAAPHLSPALHAAIKGLLSLGVCEYYYNRKRDIYELLWATKAQEDAWKALL